MRYLIATSIRERARSGSASDSKVEADSRPALVSESGVPVIGTARERRQPHLRRADRHDSSAKL